ncbi:hypothetical protein D7B24_007391 [Verticillium nonalfalfae]|uniref:Uncharacterized protein n=1 Tax=Verticillium nonalfalfae TaxID=1051616 RepID=A0A3M9Y983_9PEZI|nr:uncharacterized protein D7B24_007391 [Verticillium nonalfalfae]RNJ56336.1 hypothetical protein D7B24_007391 [Verticillium nonalfalfae]
MDDASPTEQSAAKPRAYSRAMALDRAYFEAFEWAPSRASHVGPENGIHEDVPRGPFKTTRDWMKARLMLSSRECHGRIARYSAQSEMDSDDEEDFEYAEQTLDSIKKLQPLYWTLCFRPQRTPSLKRPWCSTTTAPCITYSWIATEI